MDFFGTTKKALSAIIREGLAEAVNTPDRLVLDQSQNVLVLEYGDLQQGFNHHKLMGEKLIGLGVTSNRFFFWNVRRGPASFPLASKIPGINAGRTRIRGELYMMPSENLINLDRHRENGVKFKRKTIDVILPRTDASGNPVVVEAHFYTALDTYWKPMIEWDNQFYRGNGGSTYVPINATGEDLKRPYLSRYADFTPSNLEERDPRCFVFTKADMISNARREIIKAGSG